MSVAWSIRWTWAGLTGSAPVEPLWSASSSLWAPWASSVAVDLAWHMEGPAGPLDVPALVDAGHHPMSGRLELLAGDRVVLAGPWRAPAYGPAGTPCEGRIEDGASFDSALIPADGEVIRVSYDGVPPVMESQIINGRRIWRVDVDAWADAARSAVGAVYPLVIGAPGSADRPGSPALIVDATPGAEVIMVCGAPVEASTVTVWGPRAVTDRWRATAQVDPIVATGGQVVRLQCTILDSGHTFEATYTALGLGLDTVDLVFAAWVAGLNADASFAARATASHTAGDMFMRVVGNRPGMASAVELVVGASFDRQILLSHPSVPEQSPPLASQAGVAVAHAVDARGTAYAYISGADLDEVAVSQDAELWIAWTGGDALPGGAGDAIHLLSSLADGDTDHGSMLALAPRLNAWRIAGYIDSRVSPLELLTSAILPVLPVSLTRGEHGRGVALWPWVDDAPAEARLVVGDGCAREAGAAVRYADPAAMPGSAIRYAWDPQAGEYAAGAEAVGAYAGAAIRIGSTGAGEIETRWIWEDATAASLAEVWARLSATPARVVRYELDADRFGIGGAEELRIGQPVALTDTEMGWAGRLAVVTGLEQSGGAMLATIQLRDDALRG